MNNNKYTRRDFLKFLGVGMLTILAAKAATLERHLSYAQPEKTTKTKGSYGNSVYGA